MKKHIITLLALLCGHILTAQSDGCLIVKEFSLNEWQVINLYDLHYVDMDDDGEYDFSYVAIPGLIHTTVPQVSAREGACFHKIDIPGYDYNYPDYMNAFTDFDTPFNDSTLKWKTSSYGSRICSEKNSLEDTIVYKSGIRNGQEGEYYYGWMEAYARVSYNYDTVYFHLARTCFCTIPNYPLKWGQTSLNTNVDENEVTAFATVYPNPAKSTFTITGKSLKVAEIVNTLGQRVATAKNKGNQMTVDISSLPTGIYFINITDSEGRKCVRKVVKE